MPSTERLIVTFCGIGALIAGGVGLHPPESGSAVTAGAHFLCASVSRR